MSAGPAGPGRSFASSAATAYLATVGAAAFSFLNVLIVARVLGPEGRGDVAFLTTVATMTAVVAALSVQESNANLAGSRPASRPSLATNSLALAGLLGAGGAACVVILMAVFPGMRGEVSRNLLWLALMAIPAVVLQTYLVLLARADYRHAVANLALFLVPAGTAAVNAGLAAAGALTVSLAVGTWVAANIAAAGLLLWYVARRLAGLGPPDARLARESVGFGLRTHPSAVMSVGNFRLDQWMLGSLAGSRELGVYSVAVAWAETLFFLPTALAMVMRPDLVRDSDADASRRTAAVVRLAVVLSLPLVVILVVAAPILCLWAFGDEFRGAIDDLRVLAPGAIGIVALKIMGNALVARGRPLLESAAIGVAFAATVGLNALLIPPFGGVGAALASTIAYTLAGVAVGLIFLGTLGGRARDFVPGPAELHAIVRGGRSLRRGSPA